MLGAACVAGLQMLTEVRRAGSSQPDPNSSMDDLSDLASVATRTRTQTRALSAAAAGDSYLPDDGSRDLTSPVSDISDFSDLGAGLNVDVRDLQEDLTRRTIVMSDGEID